MRVACCVVLLPVVARPATAHEPPLAAVPLNLHPSDVDVLLAAQAVLHTVDMISARAFAGVEVWATINNINAASELQRRRAIASR